MHWMNRIDWFIEWSGTNDTLNDQGWMIHWMNRNEESLVGQEWMIHWMNRNEWFIEWPGIKDLMNEQE